MRELQHHLVRWGYPLTPDGVFGRRTENAVLTFQMAQGLAADGIAGPKTLAELHNGPVATPMPSTPPLLNQSITPGRAIVAARSYLGAKESPDGSNAGPEIGDLVDGYGDHWRIAGYSPAPWCGMAVSVWTAQALGLGNRGADIDWKRHPFGAWFGGVAQIEDWARPVHLLDDPVVGCIYTMGRTGSQSDPSQRIRAGHTGLVEAIDGDEVVVIDGNVSNRVVRTRRKIADLRLFVKWW